jgi:hypothetical protein
MHRLDASLITGLSDDGVGSKRKNNREGVAGLLVPVCQAPSKAGRNLR